MGEEDLREIKDAIAAIHARNARVDADKAWEISRFRKLSISVLTYIIASVTLWFLGNPNCLLHALVPTIGFILSTQSLPFIKRWWIANLLKNS